MADVSDLSCGECVSDGCQAEADVERIENCEAEDIRTALLQLDVKHGKVSEDASLHRGVQSAKSFAERSTKSTASNSKGPSTKPSAEKPSTNHGNAAAKELDSTAEQMTLNAFESEAADAQRLRRQAYTEEAQRRAKEMEDKGSDSQHSATPAPTSIKHHKLKHGHKEGQSDVMVEAAIPLGAFVAGAIALFLGQKITGLLSIYFGAQAGFSLYMKVVLSDAIISQELHMKGVPAAFLVTAIQQIVAFVVLVLGLGIYYCVSSTPYVPRRLTSFREVAVVVIFSAAFAANIGLNNFSLSLMAVSLNMIIRSCLPVVTLVLQQLMSACLPGVAQKVTATEVSLMSVGVVFAALATVAKSEGSGGESSESKHLMLGVAMCALSDIAAGTNLILAGMSGGLNPLDTILYMAVPCAIFLVPASVLATHPVDWPSFGAITDVEVVQKVMSISPATMGYVILSGFFAAAYNILQYTVVQQLSPGHAAFAGNFNKAATIMLSIFLGLEHLPQGVWSTVMLLAILGNIGSFTGYSLLKAGSKKAAESPDSKLPAKA
eukprot:TRINITY_DN39925_c0_g1_i1.p1 TRINITY_DN39925_c0_g1~~TRINITY_DN39925_c0_g1_i1.p1  ORF type:complete len:589 (-),score=120.43 TRINITY_DN39925_c0_g1_i1:246-1889(-)